MDNSILAIGFKKTLLSIFIATALTACGGSGGSSSHASDAELPDETTPGQSSGDETTPGQSSGDETTPGQTGDIKVKVIDGYLVNAEVFADLNGNSTRDDYEGTPEPAGKTDINGETVLSIPSSKLKANGSIKIISESKKNHTNIVLGKEKKLAQDIVMSSTIYLDENGKAKTQNFVTPFTTLTDLSLSKDESVNMSRDEYLDRLKAIASSIGLNPDVVDSDYNNTENLSQDNVKALVAGELIVRTNLLPVDLDSYMSVSELETYTQRTVTDSLSQYKDVVLDIATNTDPSEIANKLEEHEAKSKSSFRLLASGPAPDWRCGVTKTNNVYCWGNNSWGNLGDPDIYPKDEKGNPVEDGTTVPGNFSAKPVAVKIKKGDRYVPLSGVKSVSLGNVHACAVTHVGEVYCWGGNYHGQLGNVPNKDEMSKDKVKSYHAVKVLRGQQEGSSEFLSNIDYLQLGHNHSCALSNDGEVFCWGDNSSYELGGRYNDEGFEHESFEHKSYDTAIENFSGQIKLYNWITNVHVPVKLKFPESVEKVKFLSSGLWSHCAIVENDDKNDGHNLYCWGNDITGNITHNYEQYKKDFSEKGYAGKFVRDIADYTFYDIDNTSTWYMYDQSGDMYPLYGAPITLIDYYKDFTEGWPDGYPESQVNVKFKKIVNVKTVALSSLDKQILFEFNDEPSVFYNVSNDICNKMLYPEMLKELGFEFEISKLYAPVEEKGPICVLTTDKRVFCFGDNSYGLLGQGIEVGEFGGEGDYVKYPNKDQPLENVKELSLVSRSYCASVADQEKEEDEEQLSLYCWGSSAFGQMGFDKGIGKDSSFKDASDLWSPGSTFYNDRERMEILPSKITKIFENQ